MPPAWRVSGRGDTELYDWMGSTPASLRDRAPRTPEWLGRGGLLPDSFWAVGLGKRPFI